MSKNILNEELNQMKYLFGYKPGKVISEQVKSTTGGTKEESTFFTKDGVAYRFPGITDDVKLDKFLDRGKLQDFVNFMGIDQGWLSQYRNKTKGLTGKDLIDVARYDKLSNLFNGTANLLHTIAKAGITPEKLRERGVQLSMKSDPSWSFIQIATTDPTGEEGVVMTPENYFSKLSDLVEKKMNEIK